jgi:phage gpG-like protein
MDSLIEITVDTRSVAQALDPLIVRTSEVDSALLDDIGTLMLRSVFQNFESSGRPVAWPPSQRVMKRGGKTLVESGALEASGMIADRTEDSITASFGVGLLYAKIHNFGGIIQHPRMRASSRKVEAFNTPMNMRRRKMVKVGKYPTVGTGSYEIPIPARPFVMFQDEDKAKIFEMVLSYYTTGEWSFN